VKPVRFLTRMSVARDLPRPDTHCTATDAQTNGDV
jgi:hypothetical protein